MTFERLSREEARAPLARLVEAYRTQADQIEASGSAYSEAQVRLDFLDKMLQILGWDVFNQAGKAQDARDVVVEQSLVEDGSTGRPDYRLRVGGRDWIPWEAKKPSINLAASQRSAHQVRLYGFTLQRPIGVLTNFSETIIYNCTFEVQGEDGPDVGAIPGCRFRWDEYVDRFDDLWDRLSYEAAISGRFYEVLDYEEPPRGESPFDKTFLAHFRRWRLQLAQTVADENPALPAAEVGRRTQRLLNALLFLRVCEDRNISRYKDLLRSAENARIFDEFERADRVFNAGLFSVLKTTKVGSSVLRKVVTELYWPQSKFAYALLEPDTLSAVYEQYLAERVVLDSNRKASIVAKPELTHSGGVVPTPMGVVDALLDASLPAQLPPGTTLASDLSVLDPACGSGVFLVRTLQRLIAAVELTGETIDLDLRATLAKQHVFGVDIDGEAVEVARLSLLLVVLGSDTGEVRNGQNILPDLSKNVQTGNSLVGPDFDRLLPTMAMIPEARAEAAPFDWQTAFPQVLAGGGFSCIVGNPPYIRIQVLNEYLTAQLAYYQDARSGFRSTSGSFDVYMLFIEKCLALLAPSGMMALIVKSSLLTSPSATALRELLGPRLVELVHFGAQQVFPGRSTYTCLVIATGTVQTGPARLIPIDDVDAFLRQPSIGRPTIVERSELTGAPWAMASAEAARAFAAMDRAAVARLGDEGWVKVFVGVQTSADAIYYLKVVHDDDASPWIKVKDAIDRTWEIERGILRKAVRDVRLAAYGAEPEPDYVLLFPYEITPPAKGRRRGQSRLLSNCDLKENYPNALAYLEANEVKLRRRSISPNPGPSFWAYGRSQSLTALDTPKIINRTLSVVPQYVPDRSGLVTPGGGDGGPYTLLRPAPECPLTIDAVIALLSHPAVDAYIASRSKEYRGAYVVHRRATLDPVPIPPLTGSEIAELTARVQEAQALELRLRTEQDTRIIKAARERRMVVIGEINEVITAAYGLTSEQLRFLQE
ncbi:Eco57I restriction-modification methylase domain-containing protein [Micromonospora craniellae]|uniref:site-specific DNA-methyltransferase (adenine-specific) n=1 Tax=Micromonospora craniellae TaxID=2294034 RepID=A0A372FVF4_9ACTN|nr:DNA methyltransferase [Micromonospora craniellae]QOC94063.1 Eco57I restriction-modification methylase domain-containing protein [Micromonospora craniellae]RFS44755.1 hypothetical protein D0Q02_20775 [Micromonospora craniellae]